MFQIHCAITLNQDEEIKNHLKLNLTRVLSLILTFVSQLRV